MRVQHVTEFDRGSYNNCNAELLLVQMCTNPGRQSTVTATFSTVVTSIGESSVRNLFHVSLLEPRILRQFPDFEEIFAHMLYSLNFHAKVS